MRRRQTEAGRVPARVAPDEATGTGPRRDRAPSRLRVLVHELRRWAYDVDMPVIPGLRVGLTPLLQMGLLTPPILWWASRAVRVRAQPAGSKGT